MRDIQELQVLIQKAVEKIDFPPYPAKLYQPISYILDLGGKRMRPALLLMACDLFDGDVEKAIAPALTRIRSFLIFLFGSERRAGPPLFS